MEAFGKINLHKKIGQFSNSMMGELSEYVEFLLYKCGNDLNRADGEDTGNFANGGKATAMLVIFQRKNRIIQ